MSDNLEFLKEMRTHWELSSHDITRYEMLGKMIDDWIDELEQIPVNAIVGNPPLKWRNELPDKEGVWVSRMTRYPNNKQTWDVFVDDESGAYWQIDKKSEKCYFKNINFGNLELQWAGPIVD